MGEEKRHEMMETLFGAESEDSDDEPEPVRQAVSDQASDRSVSGSSHWCSLRCCRLLTEILVS